MYIIYDIYYIIYIYHNIKLGAREQGRRFIRKTIYKIKWDILFIVIQERIKNTKRIISRLLSKDKVKKYTLLRKHTKRENDTRLPKPREKYNMKDY